MIRYLKSYFSFNAYLSVDICRIFVCISALISPLFFTNYLLLNNESYLINPDPKGIVYFISFIIDDLSVLRLFKYIGFIACISSIFGIWTNFSFRILTISIMILSSLFYTYEEGSAHQFNMLNFTLIGLSLSHLGNNLSFDKLILGRKKIYHPLVFSLPILFAQFSLVWHFFSAFTYKLFIRSGWEWIFSDNMRNTLLLQNFYLGESSPIRELVSSNIFLYTSAAAINIFLQFILIFSLLFFKNPKVRSIFSIIFIFETAGLYIFAGRFPSIFSFNLEWILLACFFIDWDYFLKNQTNSLYKNSLSILEGGKLIFLIILIILNITISYAFIGKDKAWTYPFSATSMYSYTNAKKPYDKHQSFEIFAITYDIGNKKINSKHPDSKKIHYENYIGKYESVFGSKQTIKSKKKIIGGNESLSAYYSLLSIPAYPEPANIDIISNYKIIDIDSNGNMTYVLVSYQKKSNILKVEFNNINSELEFTKRKIDYDYLESLGKKHSPVIKNIGPHSNLLVRKISNNTYEIIESLDEKNYLICVKVYNKENQDFIYYKGVIINNEYEKIKSLKDIF
tara:strand:+ start:1028 stop:2728 length:1701 start_codon:yes stop_codon:yes gene_type:complete